MHEAGISGAARSGENIVNLRDVNGCGTHSTRALLGAPGSCARRRHVSPPRENSPPGTASPSGSAGAGFGGGGGGGGGAGGGGGGVLGVVERRDGRESARGLAPARRADEVAPPLSADRRGFARVVLERRGSLRALVARGACDGLLLPCVRSDAGCTAPAWSAGRPGSGLLAAFLGGEDARRKVMSATAIATVAKSPMAPSSAPRLLTVSANPRRPAAGAPRLRAIGSRCRGRSVAPGPGPRTR